jgi:hypothetical protein
MVYFQEEPGENLKQNKINIPSFFRCFAVEIKFEWWFSLLGGKTKRSRPRHFEVKKKGKSRS